MTLPNSNVHPNILCIIFYLDCIFRQFIFDAIKMRILCGKFSESSCFASNGLMMDDRVAYMQYKMIKYNVDFAI